MCRPSSCSQNTHSPEASLLQRSPTLPCRGRNSKGQRTADKRGHMGSHLPTACQARGARGHILSSLHLPCLTNLWPWPGLSSWGVGLPFLPALPCPGEPPQVCPHHPGQSVGCSILAVFCWGKLSVRTSSRISEPSASTSHFCHDTHTRGGTASQGSFVLSSWHMACDLELFQGRTVKCAPVGTRAHMPFSLL